MEAHDDSPAMTLLRLLAQGAPAAELEAVVQVGDGADEADAAEARELAELPALPVVRGVELAPRGAELSSLDVRPLEPREQGVVGPPSTRTPSDG